MTPEQIAKDKGFKYRGGDVITPSNRIAIIYAGKFITRDHDGNIIEVDVNRFSKLFKEKAPNLVTSRSKSKLHDKIRKYHSQKQSYRLTMAKFDISKGGLFLILNRLNRLNKVK